MPNGQTTINDFTLSGLEEHLQEARQTSVSGETIVVKFDSPPNFTHQWTVEGVDSAEELTQAIEETEEAAKERLFRGWTNIDVETADPEVVAEKRAEFNQKVWNEIARTLDIELTEDIEEFVDVKEQIPNLQETIQETRSIYDRVESSRRSSIGRKLNERSDSLEEYRENLQRVQQNLDFEGRISFKDSDTVEQKIDQLEDVQGLVQQKSEMQSRVSEINDELRDMGLSPPIVSSEEVEQLPEEQQERAGELLSRRGSITNRLQSVNRDINEEVEDTGVEPGQIGERLKQYRDMLNQSQSDTARGVVWWNKEGRPVRATVRPGEAVFEVGGEEIRFEDKQEALEYYEENRLG